MLQCSGFTVLEEDISHCKQKWRGQSNCCSCLRTLSQCQTVCCLDTGGWCWDLGTYKRSLESSHCSSHRQRYSTVPLWVRLWKIWSLPQLLVTFGGVPLFELQLISSLSLLAFEHLTPKWELINTCSFYAALGNNPVKEELSPFAALSLEKIAKALHETQEHHVFVVKEYVK